MEAFITRVWENLVGRIEGPMHFRLLCQPLMGAIVAVRAGLREGNPPRFRTLADDPAHRRETLRQAWKEIGKVCVAAVVLDVIYQVVELRWVYPGEAIVVAILLAIVPYVVLRATVTWLVGSAHRKNDAAIATVGGPFGAK
jgi:hypothetical protein